MRAAKKENRAFLGYHAA